MLTAVCVIYSKERLIMKKVFCVLLGFICLVSYNLNSAISMTADEVIESAEDLSNDPRVEMENTINFLNSLGGNPVYLTNEEFDQLGMMYIQNEQELQELQNVSMQTTADIGNLLFQFIYLMVTEGNFTETILDLPVEEGEECAVLRQQVKDLLDAQAELLNKIQKKEKRLTELLQQKAWCVLYIQSFQILDQPVPPGATQYLEILIEWIAAMKKEIQSMKDEHDKKNAELRALIDQMNNARCENVPSKDKIKDFKKPQPNPAVLPAPGNNL